MIIVAQVISQIATDIQPLAHYGIIGAVVAWLATRIEKRLDRMEHAFKGLSMGILMDLSSRKVLAPSAQQIVDEMLRKMGVNSDD